MKFVLYLKKSLVKKEDSKFEYFKSQIMKILEEQEKVEKKDIKKSILNLESQYLFDYGKELPIGYEIELNSDEMKKAGYPVGSVREWKGKKYIKIAPNKWRPKYDGDSRGAKLSIKALMKKVDACTSSEELMQLVMANAMRFRDEQDRPLDIVKELHNYVSKKNDNIESSKAKKLEQKAQTKASDAKIDVSKLADSAEKKLSDDMMTSIKYKTEEQAKAVTKELKARGYRVERFGKEVDIDKKTNKKNVKKDGVENDKPKSKTAKLREELLNNLKSSFGSIIKNEKSGIEARLSKKSADKMGSEKAINKSKANGFSIEQHFEVANDIINLYKKADLIATQADRNNDVNIASIKRFNAETKLKNGEKVNAYITVKESIEHGHKIYSVELTEINKAPNKVGALGDATVSSESVAPKHTYVSDSSVAQTQDLSSDFEKDANKYEYVELGGDKPNIEYIKNKFYHASYNFNPQKNEYEKKEDGETLEEIYPIAVDYVKQNYPELDSKKKYQKAFDFMSLYLDYTNGNDGISDRTETAKELYDYKIKMLKLEEEMIRSREKRTGKSEENGLKQNLAEKKFITDVYNEWLNRHNAMKGNQNAKKDGVEEKKEGVAKRLRREFTENTNQYLEKTFTNKDSGREAVFSKESQKELRSQLNNSKANGYTIQEHFELANQIIDLFENADFIKEHDDVKHNQDSVKMERYLSKEVVLKSGKKVQACITVKHSIDKNGRNIYSIEAMDIKNALAKTRAKGQPKKESGLSNNSSIPQTGIKSSDDFEKDFKKFAKYGEDEYIKNRFHATKESLTDVYTIGKKYAEENFDKVRGILPLSILYEENKEKQKWEIANEFMETYICFSTLTKDPYSVPVDNSKAMYKDLMLMATGIDGENGEGTKRRQSFITDVYNEWLNRHNAMLGNQNAKKNFTDEIKDKVIKEILSPTEERLKIDYTRENYNKLFPIGYAETPIGKIKLGGHQFERLGEKDNGTRKEYLGALAQALKEPNVIIDDVDEKGRHAKLFIKSFKDSTGNEYYVAITLTIDGIDVVVSNGIRRENQILEKIKTASMYYYAPGSQTIGTAEALPNDSSIPQTDIKSIRKNYESSKSVTGNKKTITLPNGEKMKCHYKLVEAEAPTASHDENTFSTSKGFPTNKDGKNINDRDYKNDKDAQESVRKIANNFNSLALDSPPIVTKDGIVISGNNRTMSSKLAAKNGTDKAYLESLKDTIDEFGIDEEELNGFKNPRIILEVDAEHEGDYTTNEFAQFNQDTKKTMNNVEKAVKLTKTLDSHKIQSIAETLTNYETMGELYADKKGSQLFVQKLVESGIIGDNEKAQYTTSDGMLNDTGKDFAETVLVGSVLNENNIRKLDSAGGKRIRQKLVRAILPLIENKGTGKEYSFNNELNQAVDIAVNVMKDHEKFPTVKDYVSQLTLFDDEKIDDVTARLAEIIHDDGEKSFAQRMKNLGAGLRESASGQQDIFLQEVETKDSLMKRFLDVKKSFINTLKKVNPFNMWLPSECIGKTEYVYL